MGVRILTQETPNPNAMKFILNFDVKREGKVTFTESAQCTNVPLAKYLLEIENVTQIHFFENVITVTQNGNSPWEQLGAKVEVVISENITAHDIEFVAEAEKKRSNLSPELIKIEEILDRTIRPGLQSDGGDVQVLSLERNILSIHYEGACGSCPSATAGTLNAIEGILQDEYDPNIQVIAV
jgi:Fe-S cluster biogenesis protein NfuA